MVIKVEHPNGYAGVLYGRASMAVYDPQGHEVLHTGSRAINTSEALYNLLGNIPKMIKTFSAADLEEEDEGEI